MQVKQIVKSLCDLPDPVGQSLTVGAIRSTWKYSVEIQIIFRSPSLAGFRRTHIADRIYYNLTKQSLILQLFPDQLRCITSCLLISMNAAGNHNGWMPVSNPVPFQFNALLEPLNHFHNNLLIFLPEM